MMMIFVLCALLASCPCGRECVLPKPYLENEFFCELDSCGRRLYNSLDCWGKNRAIELSDCFEDKNCAVEEAAKEMGRRQRSEYPNQFDYQDQLRQKGNQDQYQHRYGN